MSLNNLRAFYPFFSRLTFLSHVFSSSTPRLPHNSSRTYFSCKKAAQLDGLLRSWGNSRKRCLIRAVFSEKSYSNLNHSSAGFRKSYLQLCRKRNLSPLAADESVTVNGSPQASTSSDVGKMRIRLDDSRKQDYSDGLVQFLHDAARNFELAIKEHSASSKMSWFSTAWLGIDRNAWIKALSYQVITNNLTNTLPTNFCLTFTFLFSFPFHFLAAVVNNISYYPNELYLIIQHLIQELRNKDPTYRGCNYEYLMTLI